MKDVLKQRLVGALVILALGLMFWPAVFVDTGYRRLDRASQVPPAPDLAREAIKPPAPLSGVEPVAAADALTDRVDSSDPAEDSTDSSDPDRALQPKPRPTLDKKGIPIAWVLQVAAVREQAKAESLTEELIAQGYRAYHRPLQRNGERLHRVLVGPEFDRAKLAGIKRTLDQQYKVAAIIRYQP